MKDRVLGSIIPSILFLLLALDLNTVNWGAIDIINYLYIVYFILRIIHMFHRFPCNLPRLSDKSVREQWGIILSGITGLLCLMISLLNIGRE